MMCFIEIIFTKFELDLYLRSFLQTYKVNYCCFTAVTLCHTVTLTFNSLTLKVRNESAVMRSNAAWAYQI